MRESLQRLSRWVWLINGVILLLALVITGISLLAGWLAYGVDRTGEPASVQRDTAQPAPPVIRYDPPQALPGTDARLVLVREGRGLPTPPIPPTAAYRAGGAVVNAAILRADGSGRLLFDRRVRIAGISFAGAPEWLAGPLEPAPEQRHVAYAVADRDTDGDGRVGETDDVQLYVSAVDGGGLRALLPAGHRLVGLHRLGDRWMVSALQGRGAARRQRAFIFEPATGLRPFATLDSLAARAGQLLSTGQR